MDKLSTSTDAQMYQFWKDFFDQLDEDMDQGLVGWYHDKEQDAWGLDLRGSTLYAKYRDAKQKLWVRVLQERASGAWSPRFHEDGAESYCLDDSPFFKAFPKHWAWLDVIHHHEYEDDADSQVSEDGESVLETSEINFHVASA